MKMNVTGPRFSYGPGMNTMNNQLSANYNRGGATPNGNFWFNAKASGYSGQAAGGNSQMPQYNTYGNIGTHTQGNSQAGNPRFRQNIRYPGSGNPAYLSNGFQQVSQLEPMKVSFSAPLGSQGDHRNIGNERHSNGQGNGPRSHDMPQKVMDQQISIGNYQALESVRQQQQVQQQSIPNKNAVQQNIQSEAFKMQGNYFAPSVMASSNNFAERNGQMPHYNSPIAGVPPPFHNNLPQYDNGVIQNQRYLPAPPGVPTSTTSQMMRSPQDNQAQALQQAPRSRGNTRALVAKNPNLNTSRSYGSFRNPQFDRYSQVTNQVESNKLRLAAMNGGGEGSVTRRDEKASEVQQVMATPQSTRQTVYPTSAQGNDAEINQVASYGDDGGQYDGAEEGEGGVTYIPMSWGELLGGGKDGFQKMKVIMAPQNPEAPDGNRQLRLAFGDQAATTQPGEIPLKIVSINPVEGYQMGTLQELESAGIQGVGESNGADEPIKIEAKAAYGSDPCSLLQPNDNKYAVAKPIANTPTQIPSCQPVVARSTFSTVAKQPYNFPYHNQINAGTRRSDYAGTKYY